MKKAGQATIFIIVALILVGGIVLISWLKDDSNVEVDVSECEVDLNCVPEKCCNSENCVPMRDAQVCTKNDYKNCGPGNQNFSYNNPKKCVCEDQRCYAVPL
ncbi:MAG: hypothetical protein KJ600_04115 [Nanoarchaeota archaeon]|nr:hypothetical protein [Nanoarchaeota archaeon]MBU1103712.1 hypothetical protein [Nanoarchaeota archaeon]